MARVRKLNEVVGLSSSIFDELGIFNPLVGVDTHLFLDPALLRGAQLPEFKESYAKIVERFSEILKLLSVSKHKYDIAWRSAWGKTVFRETRGISIGYGSSTSDGSGIGAKLARRIIETASEILELGINDPTLFEIIPLFEPGLGADRLSDMAISIIREDIFTYTDRMVKVMRVPEEHLITFKYAGGDRMFTAIKNPNKHAPLFLLPKELLKDLPLSMEKDDIGYITYFNADLRKKLSKMIAGDASRSLRDLRKEDYREAVFTKDDFAKALAGYKATQATPYDFEKDPAGELSWYEKGKEFAAANPLRIELKHPKTIEDVSTIVSQIIDQFKKSIENHNLYELLYKDPISALKPKNERAAQRLFYAIADAYCEANNIVLSREPNAGNGPVDFKISSDYKTQVLVELKLSSGQVESGYTKQLPEYEKNENSEHSYFVVLRVTQSNKAAESVREKADIARAAGTKVPTVIIINALPRPSACRKR